MDTGENDYSMREDEVEEGWHKGVLGDKRGRSFLLEVFHPAVSKTHNEDFIIHTTFNSTN